MLIKHGKNILTPCVHNNTSTENHLIVRLAAPHFLWFQYHYKYSQFRIMYRLKRHLMQYKGMLACNRLHLRNKNKK